MRQPFVCPFCKTLVLSQNSHIACRKTCGEPECQKQLLREHSKHFDQLRQQDKIKRLKAQGVDLVTCQICKQEFEMIHYSHLKQHGLTVTKYKEIFPDSPLLNSRIHQIKSNIAISRSQYLFYNSKPIDRPFYEFMTGTLLGDGSLEKSSPTRNARYVEGGNNQDYLTWKKSFLEKYLPCTFQERLSSPHVKTGKQYKGWWIKTKVHPELTNLHSIWYSNRKILPQKFIEKYLTEFALSIWFYDDGCNSTGSFLYTFGFSENEVNFLSDILKCRFELLNSVLHNRNNQFFIRISNYSREKLNNILNKYPIKGMRYKRILHTNKQ